MESGNTQLQPITEVVSTTEINILTRFKDIEVGELVTFKPGDIIQTNDEISLRIPDPNKTPVQLALTASGTGFVYNEPVYWQIEGSPMRPERLTSAGITIEKSASPVKLLIGVDNDFDEHGDLSQKKGASIGLSDKTDFTTKISPTESRFKNLFSNPKKIDGNKLKNGSVIKLEPGDKIGSRMIPDPNQDSETTYYQTADMPVAEVLTSEGFNFLIGPDIPPNFRVGNGHYLSESGKLEGSNPFELSKGILKA